MNLVNAMDRYLKRKSENETTGTSRPNEKKQKSVVMRQYSDSYISYGFHVKRQKLIAFLQQKYRFELIDSLR